MQGSDFPAAIASSNVPDKIVFDRANERHPDVEWYDFPFGVQKTVLLVVSTCSVVGSIGAEGGTELAVEEGGTLVSGVVSTAGSTGFDVDAGDSGREDGSAVDADIEDSWREDETEEFSDLELSEDATDEVLLEAADDLLSMADSSELTVASDRTDVVCSFSISSLEERNPATARNTATPSKMMGSLLLFFLGSYFGLYSGT